MTKLTRKQIAQLSDSVRHMKAAREYIFEPSISRKFLLSDLCRIDSAIAIIELLIADNFS